MIYRVSHPTRKIKTVVQLPASKSLSNRALIINALGGGNGKTGNLSLAHDTVLLEKLLKTERSTWNCEDAGTAMRFLTAYATMLDREITMTGTERMKQRPVGQLVSALNSLGASISFLEKEGFPPLLISPAVPVGGSISIRGDISSQFISALLMIAPLLEKGLDLTLTGEIISGPYIRMTLSLMKVYGVTPEYNNHHIRIKPGPYHAVKYTCEPDWSAASYWYEMAALAEQADILLGRLSTDSLQGDAITAELMKPFGVHTGKEKQGIRLTKSEKPLPAFFDYSFSGCPDLAQTIACLCAGLGVQADLKGLQSLRIKETNRAEALQRELYNLSVQTDFCGGSKLKIYNNRPIRSTGRILKTHDDHRMAMSLAPLALKLPFVDIENPAVVQKSYPSFWKDMVRAGFVVEERT